MSNVGGKRGTERENRTIGTRFANGETKTFGREAKIYGRKSKIVGNKEKFAAGIVVRNERNGKVLYLLFVCSFINLQLKNYSFKYFVLNILKL